MSCLTVIADIFTDLAAGAFSINYASLDKNLVLTSISTAALLPLCLLPSLAPLGTASVAGVAGVFITGGAMLNRLVDGSYETGGAYADAAIWTPSFHAAGLPAAASMAAPSLDALSQASATATASLPDIGSLCFFASLLSNAFLAHYNAPSIYSELAAMPLPSAAAAAAAMEVDAAATAPAATSVESGGGGASEQEQSVLVDRLKAAVRAEAVNASFRAFIESTKLYWQERVGTSNGKGGSSRDERALAPGGVDAETTATTATVAAAVADTAEDEAMMANSILDIDPLETQDSPPSSASSHMRSPSPAASFCSSQERDSQRLATRLSRSYWPTTRRQTPWRPSHESVSARASSSSSRCSNDPSD